MRRTLSWLIILSGLFLLQACGSDSSDTTDGDSPDGDSGDNPLITGEAYLSFKADGADVSFGPDDFDVHYYPERDETNLIGPDGGSAFMLTFPGAAADSFTEADVFLTYDIDPAQGFPWGYVAGSAYDGSSLDLTITAYGEEDDWITGTFSGTFVEMHDSDATGNSLSVTEGEFALLRGNDR